MRAPDGIRAPGGRRLFRPESGAGSGPDAARGGLLEAGVYTPRPRPPLGRAVRDALGDPTRDGAAAGLEMAAVWARPDLHRRLVELLAGDAARSGAERILAPTAEALALAAPVALRLGVPLGGTPGDRSPDGPPAPGPGEGRTASAYLVACVLHDEDVAGPGPADRRGADEPSGGVPEAAGTVVRIRGSDPAGTENLNVLSVIEL